MELSFRPFNLSSIDDSVCLARWYADPAIRHLSVPVRDDSHFLAPEIASDLYARLKNSRRRAEVDWMILDPSRDAERGGRPGGYPIGHCDLTLDMPHRLTREGRVVWLGIVIGEAAYRGRGVGARVLSELERAARGLGATAVEAGVFEFNEVSLKLFRRAGYREIARLPNFTWWAGKKWDDVRFLKELVPAT